MPYANASGVQLYYQDMGSGEPLLLVHGWPASSFYWKSVIPLLARSYRVIAVDLKGFGRSDKPEHASYEMPAMAEDLAALLDALGLSSVNLMGHSMGGMISYALTIAHPERVHRLIAVSAPVHGPSAVFPYLRIGTLPGLRTLAFPLSRVQFVNRLVSTFFIRDEPVPQEVIEDIAKVTYRSALGSQLSMQSCDFTQQLAEIHCPTLLIYGQEDRVITPRQPLLAKARIPQSRLEVLECGHCPSVECPEPFSRLIESFVPTREVGQPLAATG